MACYHPILAVNRGKGLKPRILPARADLNIRLAREKYGDDLLLLPCGKCIGCSLEYSKQWALRIMLESTLYSMNSFITLTYDDKYLPKDMDVNKRNFQLFMKRLRKHFGNGSCRFFACGERGTTSGRIHLHAILFGIDFDDKTPFGRSNSGETLFISNTLSKLWPFGLCSIGEVTSESASYVARYSMKKKLSGQPDDSFLLMSRRPGIARDLFDKKFFKSSKIYTSDGVFTVPRFFQKVLENSDPEFFDKWKSYRDGLDHPDLRYAYGVENEEELFDILSRLTYHHVKDIRS